MEELKSKQKTATMNSLCNISFIIFKTVVGLLVSYTYYNQQNSHQYLQFQTFPCFVPLAEKA